MLNRLMGWALALMLSIPLAHAGENVRDWSTTAGSNSSADSLINFAEGQAAGTLNDSARSLMAAIAKWRDDTQGTLTTTGTANTYSATPSTGYTTLATGLTVKVKINASNTGASTLNLNGLGAKAIRKFNSSGEQALTANDMVTNAHYALVYDAALNSGAGAWILLSPSPSSITASGTVTSVGTSGYVTGGAITTTGTISLGNMGAVSRLLGSGSAGSGITDITLGTNLSMSGTTLNAAGATNTGRIAQIVGNSSSAVATGTTIIPVDDTIPTNTEGDQYLSQAITPQNSGSTLEVEVTLMASPSTAADIVIALFDGATCVDVATVNSGTIALRTTTFTYRMTAGTTSAKTFTVRAGLGTAGTLTVNGGSAARLFSTLPKSSLYIREILP